MSIIITLLKGAEGGGAKSGGINTGERRSLPSRGVGEGIRVANGWSRGRSRKEGKKEGDRGRKEGRKVIKEGRKERRKVIKEGR
jgi:hypothetical protein